MKAGRTFLSFTLRTTNGSQQINKWPKEQVVTEVTFSQWVTSGEISSSHPSSLAYLSAPNVNLMIWDNLKPARALVHPDVMNLLINQRGRSCGKTLPIFIVCSWHAFCIGDHCSWIRKHTSLPPTAVWMNTPELWHSSWASGPQRHCLCTAEERWASEPGSGKAVPSHGTQLLGSNW